MLRPTCGAADTSPVSSATRKSNNAFLEPIREWRAHYQVRPGLIKETLAAGTARMHAVASETMALVREAMGLYRV